MPNKVPLELTAEEMQRRCNEIQATWSEAERELRRRGCNSSVGLRNEAQEPYTVPVVNEREVFARA